MYVLAIGITKFGFFLTAVNADTFSSISERTVVSRGFDPIMELVIAVISHNLTTTCSSLHANFRSDALRQKILGIMVNRVRPLHKGSF